MRNEKLAVFWGLTLSAALVSCSTDTTESRNRTNLTRIYATVSGPGEVVVLDDETHDTLSTITVGAGPAIILATPDREQLFTANWADNTISAIDVASEQVVSIPVMGRPYVIAMAPDGKYLYAGLDRVKAVAVIDVKTHAVVRMHKTDSLPASIIVSPDSAVLYVAEFAPGVVPVGPGSLLAISASTGEVIKPKLQVGDVPAWITIGKDGKKVYTLNFLSDDVSVVDTDAWVVEATVETGEPGSQGIIGNVTPDGDYLYITNHGTMDLVAIDTATNKLDTSKTIKLDGKPVGVNFSSDGRYVYTTDFGPESANEPLTIGLDYLLSGAYRSEYPGAVSVFETATGKRVGKAISTGPGATSVVVLPPRVEQRITPL